MTWTLSWRSYRVWGKRLVQGLRVSELLKVVNICLFQLVKTVHKLILIVFFRLIMEREKNKSAEKKAAVKASEIKKV